MSKGFPPDTGVNTPSILWSPEDLSVQFWVQKIKGVLESVRTHTKITAFNFEAISCYVIIWRPDAGI